MDRRIKGTLYVLLGFGLAFYLIFAWNDIGNQYVTIRGLGIPICSMRLFLPIAVIGAFIAAWEAFKGEEERDNTTEEGGKVTVYRRVKKEDGWDDYRGD